MSEKFHHRFRYSHPVTAVHAALTSRVYWQDRISEVEDSAAVLSGFATTELSTTISVDKPVRVDGTMAEGLLPMFSYSECWYPLLDGRATGVLRGQLGETPIRLSGEFLLAADDGDAVLGLSGRSEVTLPGFGKFVARQMRAQLARDFEHNCAFTEAWLDRARPSSYVPEPSAIIADIAGVLGVDADTLFGHANLYDFGMDSMRMMALVEGWRAKGVNAEFTLLAQRYRVSDWVAVVRGAHPGSSTAGEVVRAEAGRA